MIEDALPSLARWKATVFYRTEAGLLDVKMFLDELCDLHDRIEQGPHWDTIASIVVERMNHDEWPDLTIEQSEKLTFNNSLSGQKARARQAAMSDDVALPSGNDRSGDWSEVAHPPFAPSSRPPPSQPKRRRNKRCLQPKNQRQRTL